MFVGGKNRSHPPRTTGTNHVTGTGPVSTGFPTVDPGRVVSISNEEEGYPPRPFSTSPSEMTTREGPLSLLRRGTFILLSPSLWVRFHKF